MRQSRFSVLISSCNNHLEKMEHNRRLKQAIAKRDFDLGMLLCISLSKELLLFCCLCNNDVSYTREWHDAVQLTVTEKISSDHHKRNTVVYLYELRRIQHKKVFQVISDNHRKGSHQSPALWQTCRSSESLHSTLIYNQIGCA
jgi:hypothetical protein